MQLNSIDMMLNEGVYDPGIFKVFILAGGPGSGKTFVSKSVFAGTGLKVVNSDTFFERELKKASLSLQMPDEEEMARQTLRAKAKLTALSSLQTYMRGRLGMIIDSTGRDYDMVARHVQYFKAMGYDTYMIFVNTNLDVALERNRRRERTVPEYITTKNWKETQGNMGKYQRLFGMNNFIVVDNNKSDFELTTLTMNKVSKIVNKYLRAPVQNYIAKQWINKELKKKKR